MSSRAPVELDFLGLRGAAGEHHGDGGNTITTSSFIRGMKTSAIASIGTQQLRRVIAAAEPPTPAPAPTMMTLFYNGAVATFDVSQDKAETIIRMAAEATNDKGCSRGNAFVGNFAKDMPLTRTRSLQQFLQKRKERLTCLRPYQLGGAGSAGTASKSFHVKEEAA